MNTIKKMYYLFKARFGTFTEDEFYALCAKFADNVYCIDKREDLDAKKILKVFFAHQTPNLRQLEIVYNINDDLKWLYLLFISPRRKITFDEEKFLTTEMNFGPLFRFPKKLSEGGLIHLFNENKKISRITTYVRDYELPEKWELELIERYELNKAEEEDKAEKSYSKESYKTALYTYLSSSFHKKCKSKYVQKRLLEVIDEDSWESLCKTQTLSSNVLSEDTIGELIGKGYAKALKSLLEQSYLPTVDLQKRLYAAFEDLRWELEISKLRHALHHLERETKIQLYVTFPTKDEEKIILQSLSQGTQPVFIESVVQAHLRSGFATPYYYAWVASSYPEYKEEAYKCLRKYAEECKETIR